ncbi:MAG: histidine phosphatase family protein [bacterium]|nr:histidine phosphatase family protein [bacterium]
MNAARVMQVAGTPLSEKGVEQASRLGRRLVDFPIGRLVSSDLRRAEMTATGIAEATGLEVEFEPLLQERNFGDLRGTPYAELTSDPFAVDFVPPGGESFAEFDVRVDQAWQRILELTSSTDGDLAIVTHGLVCRSLLIRHLDFDGLEDPTAFHNTGLTVIGEGAPWRVSLFNCTTHLAELASDRYSAPV